MRALASSMALMSTPAIFGLASRYFFVAPAARKVERPPKASSEVAMTRALPLSSTSCVKGGAEK